MNNSSQQIRAIALGWIRRGDCLLLIEGYDSVKKSTFYRALGGGLEFGESSVEALQREFNEEIGAQLTHIQLLDCVENIFTFNGQPGHEIVFLYQCDFADLTLYDQEEFVFYEDSGERCRAYWVPGDRLTSGDLKLVPKNCLAHV